MTVIHRNFDLVLCFFTVLVKISHKKDGFEREGFKQNRMETNLATLVARTSDNPATTVETVVSTADGLTPLRRLRAWN